MNVDRENIVSGAVVPLVAIISNPMSTTNAARIDAVRKVVDESPNVIHYELDGIHSVPDALKLFARANPELLVINGGDGTIGVVLAELLHNNPFRVTPPIAYLPGGKTNMTAADLGFKGRPEKVLRKLIGLANGGKLPEMLERKHLIEMDLGDGNAPRVGTFFGTAGIVKGIEWCREHAYSMGLPNGPAHVVAIAKLLMSGFGLGRDKTLMVSNQMAITVPGSGRLAGKYAVVTTTTLDRLVLRLKPYGYEGKGGLRFSAVEAGPANVFAAVRGLLTGAFGKKTINGVHTRRSNEIRIEGSDPVTLDGEIYYPLPDTPIVLRGDRTLTFVSLR